MTDLSLPSIPRPSLISDRIVIEIDEYEEGDLSTSRLVDPPLSPSTQYQSVSSSPSLVPTHSSCTHTTQNHRPPSPPSRQLAWKGMAGGCAGDGSLCSVCLGVIITLSLIIYCFIDVRLNRPDTY
ncbi:hypothetical protein PRIPAC_70718 [Pristionchus pacificus]|uniref:Uncharacterized protein n=1 Tax=Pristionchus pacificus TaxID=54126 RepID=A0A2A6BEQ7_PRIPA|nr:hypothetical protein PRIPAC_70718 [Pristionchus pacificus]|eukprot:PDM64369.1 hypothetical protein PRIPAC_52625 [Pristionchus pacificus]